jgi:hypothetical protein
MNILIIGAGFLGLGIKNILEKNTDISNVYLKNRENNLPSCSIDYIIDATSQKNKSECDEVVSELIAISKYYECAKIITLQSFSTLQSAPIIPDMLNFGCQDYFHTPYSKIKLYKETRMFSYGYLSDNVTFLYLPIVLGKGGAWAKHANNLNSTNKIVKVPEVKVFWTSLEYICTVINNVINKTEKRVIVSEGCEYLDVLLEVPSAKRSPRRNGRIVDCIYMYTFSFFKHFPFFINAIFVIAEKVFVRNRIAFPTAFYWFLFIKQKEFFKYD